MKHSLARYGFLPMLFLLILTGVARGSVTATVTEIRQGDPASFQVRVNRGMTMTLQPGGIVTPSGERADSLSILPGDRLDFDRGGSPRVRVSGKYLSGQLLVMRDDKLLTSQGNQVYFSPDCVFSINGRQASPGDFSRGVRVFMRIDPVTGLAGWVFGVDFNRIPEDPPGAPAINSIKGPVRGKSYRRGDSLSMTITGTPDSRCLIDIPGVADKIPAPEVSPGVYRANFTFTRADISGTRMVVHLSLNNKTATRLDPAFFDVAVTPPSVEAISPQPGKRADPGSSVIFARLSSPGTMINPSATRVYLDGRIIENGIQKNVDFVQVPLPRNIKAGEHQIRILAVDQAGNRGSATWSFRTP